MFKKILFKIDDIVAAIVLIGVVVITIINVIFRYMFNAPILWAEEVALAFYVWLVFIGASSALKRNGHIGIDYFVEKLPYKMKGVTKYLRNFVIYFVFVYVFIFLGIKLTAQAGLKLTPALGVSYQWIDIAVPIGGVLLVIHFTRGLIEASLVKSEEKGDS